MILWSRFRSNRASCVLSRPFDRLINLDDLARRSGREAETFHRPDAERGSCFRIIFVFLYTCCSWKKHVHVLRCFRTCKDSARSFLIRLVSLAFALEFTQEYEFVTSIVSGCTDLFQCGVRLAGCHLVDGIFTEPTLEPGYNLVAVIPRGALALNVTELRHTQNYLGKGRWHVRGISRFSLIRRILRVANEYVIVLR